jgi:hypothetical protein
MFVCHIDGPWPNGTIQRHIFSTDENLKLSVTKQQIDYVRVMILFLRDMMFEAIGPSTFEMIFN